MLDTQRYIIRQNALSHADAWAQRNPDATWEDYIAFAEGCEAWILRN